MLSKMESDCITL